MAEVPRARHGLRQRCYGRGSDPAHRGAPRVSEREQRRPGVQPDGARGPRRCCSQREIDAGSTRREEEGAGLALTNSRCTILASERRGSIGFGAPPRVFSNSKQNRLEFLERQVSPAAKLHQLVRHVVVVWIGRDFMKEADGRRSGPPMRGRGTTGRGSRPQVGLHPHKRAETVVHKPADDGLGPRDLLALEPRALEHVLEVHAVTEWLQWRLQRAGCRTAAGLACVRCPPPGARARSAGCPPRGKCRAPPPRRAVRPGGGGS
jgi:hypothetical protein